jgi:hypothetical protein
VDAILALRTEAVYSGFMLPAKDLYNNLKKETRSYKKYIRYSHIETAQYGKLMNLFNVFADQADKKVK